MKCILSKYFAYGMLIYTLSSLFYLVSTRTIGTPFNDSLSEEQRKIKKESAEVRKNIYVQGILLSTLLVFISQPFQKC